tara:strand:+ start:18090 stop:18572 length:483 start_codon:yes stop_codon:yes gene_type:complete
MTFDEDVLKLIQEHLPAKMFEATKERIQAVSNLQSALDRQVEEIDRLEEGLKSATEMLNKHENLDERTKVVRETEKELCKEKLKHEERKRDLRCEKMAHELCLEQSKSQFCREVALGLVRNVEYKKSTLTQNQVQESYNNNGEKTAIAYKTGEEETTEAK